MDDLLVYLLPKTMYCIWFPIFWLLTLYAPNATYKKKLNGPMNTRGTSIFKVRNVSNTCLTSVINMLLYIWTRHLDQWFSYWQSTSQPYIFLHETY